MRYHLIGLIVVVWLAGWQIAAAQPGGRHCNHTLYGVVTDSETLEPLVDAKVFFRSSGKGVLTGMNGEYEIRGLCDGVDTVTVTHAGCETRQYAVEIKENTHLDIQLPHNQYHTDTVHIHDKHANPKPTQAESSLTGKDLEKLAGKSLGEALKEIAGVNALQTGPSIFKPMIHGMHSNRIVIMNNGVRQESQQWGSEHAPEIDPFTATRLSVVKGANSVRYGPDAIAGVVLVEPGPLPDSAGMGGAIHMVGATNGWMGATAGVLEGRFKKPLAWRLQGSLKRSGNFHAPDYILANTGLSEANFSGAAGWTRERYAVEAYYSHFSSNIGIFAGSHIGNLTDLQNAIASDTPLVSSNFTYAIAAPKQHITHDLAKVKAWAETGHVGILNATFAWQHNLRQEYDNHRSSASDPGAPQLHYEISTASGEVFWEHNKFKDLKGMVGITGQTQVNHYEGFFFIPNFWNFNLGPFLLERLVKLRWELEAGIRYDRRWNQIWMWQGGEIISPKQNWQNFSGSLGGLVRLNEHLSIHGNVGSAWRPPTMNELFSKGLHHGAASFEIGDSTLGPEQALNSTLSLEYRGHNEFSGELGVYYNYIHDFIYQEPVQPATLTVRGAFPTFVYKQVDAQFMGVDMAFAWEVTHHLAWNAKASIVRAQNLTTDQPLIYIPPDRFESGLTFTFTGGKYIHTPSVGLSGVITRRQDRFPAGVDYALPPAAWALLNAEAGGTLVLGKFTMDLGLGAYNLTNTRYRDYMNRFRYYADEMGRNYSLRVKIPFGK
jgi:iron complex outermembrane recepter protein